MKRFELSKGYIEFSSDDEPDCYIQISKMYNKVENQDFYINFYKSPCNPLLRTRLIQFESVLNELLKVTDLENKKILEIGCGDGIFIDFLKSKNLSLSIVGVDPCTDRKEECFVKESIESFSSLSKFDIVILLDVIEHFEDTQKIINLCYKHLDINGLLVIKVPNKSSLLYRCTKATSHIFPQVAKRVFSRIYQEDFPPPHFKYFNLKSLKNELHLNYLLLSVSYISETPIKGLWSRTWGTGLGKPFLILFLFLYEIIVFGRFKDGLLTISKKN